MHFSIGVIPSVVLTFCRYKVCEAINAIRDRPFSVGAAAGRCDPVGYGGFAAEAAGVGSSSVGRCGAGTRRGAIVGLLRSCLAQAGPDAQYRLRSLTQDPGGRIDCGGGML